MKVSFLVTYYNQEQYVEQSINSILNIEKDFDWEILIADDGSTDNTSHIIQKYIELYPDNIKLFVTPRSLNQQYHSVKRVSSNRLKLLEHTTGDIFCILDGDDFYIDTQFIQESLTIFNQNPNISIIAYGYQYLRDGQLETATTIKNSLSHSIINQEDYLKNFYIHAGACVYRKCFSTKRINQLNQWGYYDDNDIVINNLCYGELYFINRSIYVYRQTGFSVYTGMKRLEQAVLNVQGFDIDCNIAPQFVEVLTRRNFQSILYIYLNKNKLTKHFKSLSIFYYNLSKNIPNSLLIKILNYNRLNFKDRFNLLLFILTSACKFKKSTINTLLTFLRGK